MSPINRVRERAKAAGLLKVSLYPKRAELKAAWKKLGFATHPDHEGGSHEEFAEAKAAFDLLSGTMAPEPAEPEPVEAPPARTVQPRRVSSSLGPGIGF